jgi:isopentenyl phosphate kinase
MTKTQNKTVEELRAEGWGVVLISPKEFEQQAGKLSRAEIELIEDLLKDESINVISSLHWAPSWRGNV